VQLPAVQQGVWKTVKRRMQGIVTRLVHGEPLHDVMTSDGLIDVTDQPGLLVMAGMISGSETSFYCYLPWKLAWDAMFDLRTIKTSPSPLEDAVFEASLRTSWGVLGLMASDSQAWLLPRERHEPFLNAALAAWNELDAVGARYYVALQGKPLWSVPNNLHYVLANMGVPTEVLRAPLPAEGPRALLPTAGYQRD
jgi:hypothetical protein